MSEHGDSREFPSPSPSPSLPSSSPVLQGERVTFTGTLASMTHREAGQLVEKHGGMATEHASRQTTMLVVGEEGWPLEPDGNPSIKIQNVAQWMQEGADIKIVRESEWLHLLDLDPTHQTTHGEYTPAMLSQILDVPVHVVRGWERAGLIKAVRKVHRLPYFDFQEVTGARRLCELVAEGVSIAEIQSGLRSLESTLPGVERPLAQLHVLASDRKFLYRDTHGLVETSSRQRRLQFEPQPPTLDEPELLPMTPPVADEVSDRQHWTAQDWLAEGLRLSAENALEPAVEAFRMSLMDFPGDSEVNFYLAETLYRIGNSHGARERYYAAVEADHDYIEAWTQLGCVEWELGNLDQAVEALKIALSVHPDYPEAHLHIAEVLHQSGRTDEAVPHWQAYLEFDTRGPWADQARQRLEKFDR